MTAVGISGHRVLSESVSDYVSDELRTLLNQISTWETIDSPALLVGYSCLAIGADQTFARSVLDAGGELVAVIPCEDYEQTFAGDELGEYRRLLGRCREVITLPFASPSEEAFMAAGEELVRRSELLIAVWDGRPAVGLGGTGDVVALATSLGRETHIIWPTGVER